MKNRILACFLTMGLALTLLGCGGKESLRFGTGNNTGKYYDYGTQIAQLAAQNNTLSITVKETAGSAANLRLMKEDFLDLAIVQSDVLSDAHNGTGSFDQNAYTQYQVIAELYTEQCQLIVPAASDIYSIADLAGKKVSIGEKDSGVYGIAGLVLQANGMKEDSLSASFLSFSDSAEALANGQIDAFFLMAGVPTGTVTGLQEQMELRLIALDDRTISYMTNLYEGYTATTIAANTYDGMSEDIATIGVNAVFIADEKVSDQSIEKIKEILHANPIF